jgi:hypothetical protein
LETEFGGLVDELDLDPSRKRYLKARWLDQLTWLEGKASNARDRYYALRLVTIVGAVLVPALVGIDAASDRLDLAVRIALWVVSLVVAISAAVEQFFHYGDRWRNYRQTAERVKSEGWLFLQLSGPYAGATSTHAAAYTSFAARVEELIGSDVDVYVTKIAVEAEKRPG